MLKIKEELLDSLRRRDLLRAALLVGKIEDPRFDGTKHRETVLKCVERVLVLSAKQKRDPILLAETINQVFYQELKLLGKSNRFRKVIDNPEQFYLHHVLEKKKGSPLALVILYWIVAEKVGMQCECIAFPSHYFLKVKDVNGSFYIDPFEMGKFLTASEFQRKFRVASQRSKLLSTNLYEQLSPKQLIGKLIQRLKHVYIIRSDAIHAVRAVELLTTIHPKSPELARDRGILYCEMEYFSRAIDDLRYYIKARPKAEDIKEIKKLTSMLRGYRETMN